jgi:ER lumen protein retaining receptor
LTDSLYLTTFKLLFIGSSAYIIYLMLNDYKPTHDPNIDTFKVQYLLGISVILALLFPHDYRLSEVRTDAPTSFSMAIPQGIA